jgi:hypothetical protein
MMKTRPQCVDADAKKVRITPKTQSARGRNKIESQDFSSKSLHNPEYVEHREKLHEMYITLTPQHQTCVGYSAVDSDGTTMLTIARCWDPGNGGRIGDHHFV